MAPKKKLRGIVIMDPQQLSNDEDINQIINIPNETSTDHDNKSTTVLSNLDIIPTSSNSSSNIEVIEENIEDIIDDIECDELVEGNNFTEYNVNTAPIFNNNVKASDDAVALPFYQQWFQMEKKNMENIIIIESISQQFFISYVSEMIPDPNSLNSQSIIKSFQTIIYQFILYNDDLQTRTFNQLANINDDNKDNKFLSTVKQTIKRKLELMILTCMYLFLKYWKPDIWGITKIVKIKRNEAWLKNIENLYFGKVKNILQDSDYVFMGKVVEFFMIENKEREFFNRNKVYQLFHQHNNPVAVDTILDDIRNDKKNKLIRNQSNTVTFDVTANVDEIIMSSRVEESNPVRAAENRAGSKEIIHRKKSFIAKNDPMNISYSRSNKKVSIQIYF